MAQDITFVLRARNEARNTARAFSGDLRQSAASADEVTRSTRRASDQTKALGDNAKVSAANFALVRGAAVAAAGAVGALLAGFASVAVVGQAVQSAREFNGAIAETSTLLDGTPQQIDDLAESARRLAATYGTSGTEQVRAFYQAISAGAEAGAEATTLLEQANKLAIGGVTDVTSAVDILTTVVNSYGPDAITAAEASDALFVAMRAGKTTVGELSRELGQVIPVAQSAGIGIDEVSAAVATITTRGVRTNQAVTQLRAFFNAALQASNATSGLGKVAAELGVDFSLAALQSNGLKAVLDDITEATGGNAAEIQRLVGSSEALQAVLQLTAGEGATFAAILDDMRVKAGATEAAFQEVSAELDQRLKVALASIFVNLERIGQVLLAVLVPAVELFAGALDLVVSNVDALLIALGLLAARALPAAIASVIAFSGSLAGAALALNAAIIAARLLGIALNAIPFVAVVAGLTALIRGFNDARAVQAAYQQSLEALEGAFVNLSDAADVMANVRTPETIAAFKAAADEALVLARANLEAARAALENATAVNFLNVILGVSGGKILEAAKAVEEAEARLAEAEAAADAAGVALSNAGNDAANTAADMADLEANVRGVKAALDSLSSSANARAVTTAGQQARLQTLQASGNIQAARVAQEVAETRARNAEAIANAPADARGFLNAALEREVAGIRETAALADQISTVEDGLRAAGRSSSRGGSSGGSSGGGSARERQDAVAKAVQALTERFREQAETAALSGRALEDYQIRQELLNAAQQDGVALSDTIVQGVLAQRDAYEEAAAASDTFAIGAAKGFADFAASLQSNAEFAAEFAGNAFRGLSDTISNFVRTGKLDFRSLIADLLGQISSFLANRLLIDFLGVNGNFGGGIGGGAGQRGGTLDFLGSLGGAIGGLFGREAGGPVAASQPYIVGERGPELFVPRGAGTIMSNSDTMGMGGGVVINMTVNTPDVAGFRRSQGQIAADLSRRLERANTRNN